MDPLTRGDPTSPLRDVQESRKTGGGADRAGVREFDHGGPLAPPYRLQSPRKRREGTAHPDRNAQFEHINATADGFLTAGQPVVSVDTKKKELVSGTAYSASGPISRDRQGFPMGSTTCRPPMKGG